MADYSFFNKPKSVLLSEIMDIVPCQLSGDGDIDLVLNDVASLKGAEENHLSFLDNIKYKDDFINTKAGACFVSSAMAEYAPDNVVCLITEAPYKSYALAAQSFYPEVKPEATIASTAVIEPSAKIADGVIIGHHVYIGEHVEIGKNSWIEANTTIGNNVQIGADCRIGTCVSISHTIIGSHTRLYPGVRVGQDGFGFAIDPAGHIKVPQLGRVIIGDHVEIGANTTIDRGAGPDTIIGQGTWIDNLVQIAHNVVIGRGCVIVSQVGVSGSTKIQDYVAIGGQVGIAGHLNIGMGVKIGAQAGVISDIPAGSEYLGSPAMPKPQFFRQVAALNRLIKRKKKA